MSATTKARADQAYDGARQYLEQGDLQRALAEIEAARALYIEANELDSALRTDLGRINVLDDLGRHEDSAKVGEEMVNEVRQRQSTAPAESQDLLAWLEAAASENHGASLGWLGRHGAAAESLAKAEAAYDRIGSAEDRARVRANLGIEHLEMGDHDRALAYLDDALAELVATGADHLVTRAQTYRSAALSLAGQYSLALDALADADESTAGGRAEIETVDELRGRARRAEVLATLGLWNDASRSARRLSQEFERLGLQRDRAQMELVQAVAFRSAGRRDVASIAARTSVDLFEQINLPLRAARATLTLATCIEQSDAHLLLLRALDCFESAEEKWGVAAAAIQLAEISSSSEDQLHWLDRAVDAGVEAYPELEWRASWLRGLLAEQDGRCDDALSLLEKAVETLRGLRRNVVVDQLRLPFMAGRRDPVEALVELQLRSGRTVEALHTTADERAWSLLQHRAEQSGTTRRETAAGALTYQSIGDRLFVFVPHDDGQVKAVELPLRISDVRTLADRLDAQWRRLADPRMRVHLDQLRSATDRILQDLYVGLIAPVEWVLNNGPLVIVPTGDLASLPFHAFHDGTQYLIERQQISISASPFIDSKRSTYAPPRTTLVVGVADALAPHIRHEVESIAELTSAEMLVESVATIEAVRRQAPEHDVVHFACHSQFDPENPDLSAFKLADGWVRAAELASWSLDGQTIVMASCSSGVQSDVAVDEFDGLPRALLAAGSDAVVVNLWPVDDEASVSLMSHFHLALRTHPAAQALRSAQLAALDLFPHPYLWAPAVTYTAHASHPDHRRI